MRLLWIGKRSSGQQAGDEIFDDRTVAALRAAGHTVARHFVDRVGRTREMANVLSGLPRYRTRFASPGNRDAVGKAMPDHDAAICSWEPLDVLATSLRGPVVQVIHNVTSNALPSLFPGNPIASILSAQARAWEGRVYKHNVLPAVIALSTMDLGDLAKRPEASRMFLAVPGMPPADILAPDAIFQPELTISGTDDFRDVADHEFFIRVIRSSAEIAGHVAELSSIDQGLLRSRFASFQARCAERFTWASVSNTVVAAAKYALTYCNHSMK